MIKALESKGASVRSNFQVVKFLVQRDGSDGVKYCTIYLFNANNCDRVTKVVWKNMKTGEQKITAVDKLLFSFGPSAQLVLNTPKYTLFSHFQANQF